MKNKKFKFNDQRSRAGPSTSVDTDLIYRINVGRDFQATIPELQPEAEHRRIEEKDRALMIWKPSDKISDEKVERYLTVAKNQYGYNEEQALGMLFWHDHDVKKSLLDLSIFITFPDEWSNEDRVLFEEAFQFHGKNFRKIQQMLPKKSMASLIKYYYGWKKTGTDINPMKRRRRKRAAPKEESAEESDE